MRLPPEPHAGGVQAPPAFACPGESRVGGMAGGARLLLATLLVVPLAPAQTDYALRPDFLPVRNHAGELPKATIAETVGSGVCVLDYDADGLPDLYFADGGDAAAALEGRPPEPGTLGNRLFRNRGGLRFEDVTETSGVGDRGYAGACAAADFDNDGDTDLLVVNLGPNVFFENRGDGTFRRATSEFGLAHDGFGVGAAFSDLDGDGWPDLYVVNYVDRFRADLRSRCPYFGLEVFCGPNGLPAEPDVLYRNQGGRFFEDVTRMAGVHAPDARSFSVLLTDLDGDLLPEIRVAADATRDLLFRNRGGMGFEDVSLLSGAAYSGSGMEQSGMGSAAGDFDGDGDTDLVVTNFQRDYNTFFRNRGAPGGPLRFTDDTAEAGLSLTTLAFLGWAVLPLDLDHDGDLDLFFANGHIYPELRVHPELGEPYEQSNQFFRNDGTGFFAPERIEGPLRSSRGGALADLDSDGDLDLVVTNLDASPDLLLGEPASPAVRLRLVGTASSREGWGARIEANRETDRVMVRELRGSDGFLGSNELLVLLGLGEASHFPQIRVFWPSGTVSTLREVRPGTFLLKEDGESPQ